MTSQLLIILLAFGSTSGLIDKPQNTAGVAGSTITLRCSGTQSEGILIWQKSNQAQPTQFYSLSPPKYNAQYSPDTRVSVLTISNLAGSDAGTYVCRPSNNLNTGAYAHVIVLTSPPSCSGADLTKVASMDTVTTTCRAPYKSGFNYAPMMMWQYYQGATLTATSTTTSSEVTSSYTDTITCDHAGRQYYVELTFPAFDKSKLPDPTWDHATNPPTYAYLYASDAMVVFCLATGVTITPTGKVDAGTTVTCQAQPESKVSNPTYTLRVTYGTFTQQYNAQEQTIPEELKGYTFTLECLVTQTHDGRSFMLSKEERLEVNAAGRPQQCMSITLGVCGLHAFLAAIR